MEGGRDMGKKGGTEKGVCEEREGKGNEGEKER